MKKTAQSLTEFAIILLIVTTIAIGSLQLIENRINSSTNQYDIESEIIPNEGISQEETNCTKMGLHWDKQNGLQSPIAT